jgi:hypothetical protein
MSNTDVRAAVAPDRILDTLLYARFRGDALAAAIDLDLFTAVGGGISDVAALAERCGAAERGIRALCDFLVAAGFLTGGWGRYGLTPDTRLFLDRRSRAYIGSARGFMASPHLIAGSSRVLEAVRQGGAFAPDQDPALWRTFAESMIALAEPNAARIAELLDAKHGGMLRVLDVAAGHGAYGIAVLRANPAARVVALDYPGVVEVAAQRASAAGFGARHSTLAGDAHVLDLGGPYDLILMANLLHNFGREPGAALLARLRGALAPDGRIATVEFLPAEDRVSPPWPAMFDLVALAVTGDGRTYTLAELTELLEEAGFTRNAAFALPPSPATLVVSMD